MIRHLTRIGDSYAIIIDNAVLELLGIDETTPLDVRTDGVGFSIRPAPGAALGVPLVAPSGGVPAVGAPAGARPPIAPSPTPPAAPVADVRPPATPRGPTPPAPTPPAPPAPTPPAPSSSGYDPEDELGELPETTVAGEASEDEPVARTPTIIVTMNDEVVLEYPFTLDEVVIGRNKAAQIHLDDRALSRDHAKLSRRGASFWVADLGSANGTYVNDERISEPRLLHAGEVVVIGRYQLRIEGVEQAPQDTAVLTINGPDGTHRFAMVDAEIVVGRSEECDVSINNRSISRRHLQISVGPTRGRFIATNISGRNVVKVSGDSIVDPTEFGLGDVIEIGEFSITVGYLDQGSGKKHRTMLVDRNALAKAAYVDGDSDNVAAGGRPMIGAPPPAPPRR